MTPLFPSRPDPRMLCCGCHVYRDVDQANATPGVIPYLPCVTCGDVGIYREGDLHQTFRVKKTNRPAYEDSTYRGGHLPTVRIPTGLTEA